jgi:uncharacterized membrane protein YhiD involved in acid resistance
MRIFFEGLTTAATVWVAAALGVALSDQRTRAATTVTRIGGAAGFHQGGSVARPNSPRDAPIEDADGSSRLVCRRMARLQVIPAQRQRTFAS